MLFSVPSVYSVVKKDLKRLPWFYPIWQRGQSNVDMSRIDANRDKNQLSANPQTTSLRLQLSASPIARYRAETEIIYRPGLEVFARGV